MGGTLDLEANLSSQYVSSILMTGVMAQSSTLILNLVGNHTVSKPYIEMTLAMMREFGVEVSVSLDFKSFQIPNERGYISPGEYFIECDASSATYPLCIAAIVRIMTINAAFLMAHLDWRYRYG